MLFSNTNIFVLLSYVLSVYSIAFSALIYYIHLRRREVKAIIYFLIYSLVIFIVSALTFISLSTSLYKIAFISSQILIVFLFLSPISLLCFIISFLETELSKTSRLLQQIMYIPALIISAVILITRSVNVSDSKYGYILRIPNMAIVNVFYFVTMYLIIIFIIRFEIYNAYDNYYPTTKQGLDELTSKGYIKNLSTHDLWDNPYSYISDGIKYTLQSNGVDKESGTDDDIVFENGVMTAIGSYGGNDNSISLSSDIKNEEGS